VGICLDVVGLRYGVIASDEIKKIVDTFPRLQLAVFLLYWLHVGIRSVFYLAVIPGLLAFFLVLLVKETPVVVAAKAKIDVSLQQFPTAYWKYLLATALFGLGNSSNAFLILRTQDIGVSLETTILIYAAFNLVGALISYPAGSLSDSWGAKNVLLVSFIIFLIGYLGFALTQNVVLIAGLFVFYGLFQGIFRTEQERQWHQALYRIVCARAASAGTIQPLDFYSSSQVSLQVSCGTTSGTWPYSTMVRLLLSLAVWRCGY
jgi:hypothetical protein